MACEGFPIGFKNGEQEGEGDDVDYGRNEGGAEIFKIHRRVKMVSCEPNFVMQPASTAE